MILNRLNYLNESIPYYNGKVYEYDIKHAYPSILKDTDFKFEDPQLRHDIQNLIDYTDKKSLLIRIGKEIRTNKDIGLYLNEKLLEIIEYFQTSNNIIDKDLIAIKKDAIFTTKKCTDIIFNSNIEFIEKHSYDMYFYNFLDKHEYYISKTKGQYFFDIKGIGKNFDTYLYKNLVNLIYISLTSMDLTLMKKIQQMFMKNPVAALFYCPELMPYNDEIYIKKEDLIKHNKVNIDDIRDVYFTYYAPVCKVLLNYII